MKVNGLPKSDALSLVRLLSGPRQVSEVVVREVETGRNTLTRFGLAVLDGDIMSITDEGREAFEPGPDDIF